MDLAADCKGYEPLSVMEGAGGDGVTLLPIIDAAYRLALEINLIRQWSSSLLQAPAAGAWQTYGGSGIGLVGAPGGGAISECRA